MILLWLLYLSGLLWAILFPSLNVLQTVLISSTVLGIVSFILAVKIPSLRLWYVLTGVAGIVPFLLAAFYIWAAGSGWRY